MKTYLSEIFPKIQKYSEKLDNHTLLTNQHWVLIDNIETKKTVYIFRSNGELLISLNGKISKGHWESLGNKSFLIEIGEACYLYKHGFFDKNILALKIDGIDEYSLLVNETKFDGELNTIENITSFLKTEYLTERIKESKTINAPLINDNLEYVITDKKNGWAMDTGKYVEYFISFKNRKGSVVYSSKINKFCFSKYDKVECFDDLEMCILKYNDYLENR